MGRNHYKPLNYWNYNHGQTSLGHLCYVMIICILRLKFEKSAAIDRFHSCDQKPSNCRYAAILVEKHYKQTESCLLYEDVSLHGSWLKKRKRSR